FENLNRGMRDTRMTHEFHHSEFKAEFDRSPKRLETAMGNLLDATLALSSRKDVEELERLVAKVRHERLPGFARSTVEVLEANLRLKKQDPEGALKHLEAAAVLTPERPS
ncbi:hypothetical protein, partial [Salmonella enterica]|uniref:hypothetical protein n=1 Tax=Salmonella enterica TaxID=28901 RepID=UPI003524B5F6